VGGIGVISTVPVTAAFFGGGGGGYSNTSAGTGGSGGGGNAQTAGTANTGGGGGGAGPNGIGSSGGSGVVVLRFPASLSVVLSSGITFSLSGAASGAEKICTITAGTGTVTFN
jgi:hypothetical protein